MLTKLRFYRQFAVECLSGLGIIHTHSQMYTENQTSHHSWRVAKIIQNEKQIFLGMGSSIFIRDNTRNLTQLGVYTKSKRPPSNLAPRRIYYDVRGRHASPHNVWRKLHTSDIAEFHEKLWNAEYLSQRDEIEGQILQRLLNSIRKNVLKPHVEYRNQILACSTFLIKQTPFFEALVNGDIVNECSFCNYNDWTKCSISENYRTYQGLRELVIQRDQFDFNEPFVIAPGLIHCNIQI